MVRVDSLGRKCPQPIIDLSLAMKSNQQEEEFELLSDDVATWSDLAAWSRMTGHLVERVGVHDFRIARRIS